MRHEEGPKVFNDLSERARPYGNILKEGSPLPLFCLVLGEGRRQSIGSFRWNFRLTPCEGGGNRSCEPFAIELLGSRQNPDVVEILHTAVGAPQHDHRLKLFGYHRLTRIGA